MNSSDSLKANHLHSLRSVAETAILALIILLIIRFAVQNFSIDGISMEPSLHNSELMLVDKITYLFHTPARGDVVVFVAPPEPQFDYVKRVIGVPGDTITINGTRVIVDGITLKESYIAATNQGEPWGARKITNLTIPANDYFVMGDNRAVSSDSRIWGFVPGANIIGRVSMIYWPMDMDNSGFIHNASSVFAHLPASAGQGNLMMLFLSNINALWLIATLALLLIILRWEMLKRLILPDAEPELEQEF